MSSTPASHASPAVRDVFASDPSPQSLREILFASDLSPASDRAFDHAKLLAERFDAHLVLYHALALEVPPRPGPVHREINRRLERAARDHLAHSAALTSAACEVRVEPTASTVDALLASIRSAAPDLTVMSTHGRQGVARLVLGSVTETVLENVPGPTLCIREPEHGAALPYRRLLVPTDLSAGSRRAFPIAALLARAFDAQVFAVHAADVRAGRSTWGITSALEDALPSESALAGFLDPWFAGIRVVPRAEVGCPWDCITRIATEDHVDLIVMSTHGVDSLSDVFRGSHAERVVRQSPCPVLVV